MNDCIKPKRIAIPFVEFHKDDFITKDFEYEVLDLNVTTPKGLRIYNDKGHVIYTYQGLFHIIGC